MRINPSYQIAAAGLLFIVTTLISRDTVVAGWESEAFNAVYTLPEILYPAFYIITQFGSAYMLVALAAFYLVRKRYHIVIRFLMVGTFAYLLAGFAKSIWGRARPDELLSNIVTFDVTQGPGFPSGHVALATALALTLGHYVKRQYHWIPLIWIVAVGLSRMYLGVHLPLDIIGGFALGWLAYALFRHVRIYDNARD